MTTTNQLRLSVLSPRWNTTSLPPPRRQKLPPPARRLEPGHMMHMSEEERGMLGNRVWRVLPDEGRKVTTWVQICWWILTGFHRDSPELQQHTLILKETLTHDSYSEGDTHKNLITHDSYSEGDTHTQVLKQDSYSEGDTYTRLLFWRRNKHTTLILKETLTQDSYKRHLFCW